jgi:YD repeat-containing protein
VAGQVTGLSLGNGVSENYEYDSNRMQLVRQVATRQARTICCWQQVAPGVWQYVCSNVPAVTLMDISYSYQALAGQSGAGTVAGNAGQLMSVSGTINGTTESASYSYDNLGRLVTSSQASNGASVERRYAYDRWGNRLGVWDAVSGGNQIQSITLEQNAGVTTNRIAAAGGTNYSYD